ncbi:MAG: AAA family ATPase [Candidatus Nanoarchaeia archaeon]|nr:AAA family ATPase [Candidatus Nanoarchaeia archaeon]MDD5740426.1 AAA family ATPase [Candidatus Nanoarchaeia archaeon]
MKGLLIICEGLDGTGKTTTIKQLLSNNKENNDYIYSKGIGSDTFIGKLARKFPSTLLFLLELMYIQYRIIKPNLKQNKIILQDRYDLSILSYPTAEREYNKLIAKIFKPFIIKPDALVYFHASLEEIIKRLSKSSDNKYHKILSKNPHLIISRENKYLDLYTKFNGYKTKIDTTNKTAEQSSKALEIFVYKNLKTLDM